MCALVSATRLMSLRLSQTMKRAASRGPAGIVCTGMTHAVNRIDEEYFAGEDL